MCFGDGEMLEGLLQVACDGLGWVAVVTGVEFVPQGREVLRGGFRRVGIVYQVVRVPAEGIGGKDGLPLGFGQEDEGVVEIGAGLPDEGGDVGVQVHSSRGQGPVFFQKKNVWNSRRTLSRPVICGRFR